MKIYIIPAYEDTINNQGYRQIIAEAKKKKYEIIVLNLQIKGRSLVDLVNEGIEIIGKNTNSIIFGFSVGALIAFFITKKIPIKKGIFCSVSPILNEDIPKNDRLYIKYFSKKTVVELRKTRYGKSISPSPYFICGEKEGRKMIGRSKKLCKVSKGNFVIIKNNNHELNTAYQKEIIKLL